MKTINKSNEFIDINLREKEFHNKLQLKTCRFENIFCKAIFNISEDFFNYLKDISNNCEILDYGCGVGAVEKIAKYNPKITGIDIFEVSIDKAIDNTKSLDIDVISKLIIEKQANSNSFDIVYGTGIYIT